MHSCKNILMFYVNFLSLYLFLTLTCAVVKNDPMTQVGPYVPRLRASAAEPPLNLLQQKPVRLPQTPVVVKPALAAPATATLATAAPAGTAVAAPIAGASTTSVAATRSVFAPLLPTPLRFSPHFSSPVTTVAAPTAASTLTVSSKPESQSVRHATGVVSAPDESSHLVTLENIPFFLEKHVIKLIALAIGPLILKIRNTINMKSKTSNNKLFIILLFYAAILMSNFYLFNTCDLN